jgi:hypothetical protein
VLFVNALYQPRETWEPMPVHASCVHPFSIGFHGVVWFARDSAVARRARLSPSDVNDTALWRG